MGGEAVSWLLTSIRVGLRLLPLRLREATAARLFLSVRDHGEPEREARWRARGEAVTVAGQDAVAFGPEDGPVALLMHGWEGRGLQLCAWIEPLVDAGHRVIALDGPGHGRERKGRPGLPTWVAFLHEALDAYPVDVVIAHSLGGAAGILAARRAGYHGQILCLGGPPDPRLTLVRARRFMGLPERGLDTFKDALARRFRGMDMDDLLDIHAAAATPGMRLAAVVVTDDDDVTPAESRGIIDAAGGTTVELEGPSHRSVMWDPRAVAAGLGLLGLRVSA